MYLDIAVGLSIGFVVSYVTGEQRPSLILFGVVWFLGTMAHFIHDTFDGGRGIQWLHPFSCGYYTLAAYSPQRYFKNKEEQCAIAAVHGNPRWLEEQYLRINPKLVFELSVLAIVFSGIIYWLIKK